MKAVKVQGDTEKKDLTYIIARVRNYYVINLKKEFGIPRLFRVKKKKRKEIVSIFLKHEWIITRF